MKSTFLLLCLSFDIQPRDLLGGISVILRSFVQSNSLSSNVLINKLLLYSDHDLSGDINKKSLPLTLNFIHRTGRFDKGNSKLLFTSHGHHGTLLLFLLLVNLFHIGYSAHWTQIHSSLKLNSSLPILWNRPDCPKLGPDIGSEMNFSTYQKHCSCVFYRTCIFNFSLLKRCLC